MIEAERLECILSSILNGETTVYGMKSRALIADVRGDHASALIFRKAQVEAMILSLRLGGPSGFNSVERIVYSEAGGDIDDSRDIYDPAVIVQEWRCLIWGHCELGEHKEALAVIEEIDCFARCHAVIFNAKERREAVWELVRRHNP
jgi:hypothetical protein